MERSLYNNARAAFPMQDPGKLREMTSGITDAGWTNGVQNKRQDCLCSTQMGLCIQNSMAADHAYVWTNYQDYRMWARSCDLWYMLYKQPLPADINAVFTVEKRDALIAVVPLRFVEHGKDDRFPYKLYKQTDMQVVTFTVMPVDFMSPTRTHTAWTKLQVASVETHPNASLSEYYPLFNVQALVGLTFEVRDKELLFDNGKLSMDASPVLGTAKNQGVPIPTGTGTFVNGITTLNCKIPSAFTVEISFDRQYQEPILNMVTFESTGVYSWFDSLNKGEGDTLSDLATARKTQDMWKRPYESANDKYNELTKAAKTKVDDDAALDGWWEGYFRTCLRRKLKITAMELANNGAQCQQAPSSAKVRSWLEDSVGITCKLNKKDYSYTATSPASDKENYASCMLQTEELYAIDGEASIPVSPLQATTYIQCVKRNKYFWAQESATDNNMGPGECKRCSGVSTAAHMEVGTCVGKMAYEKDCCLVCKAGYFPKPLPNNESDPNTCVKACGTNRYFSVTGDGICRNCQNGEFSASGAETRCTRCGPNEWSRPSAVGCHFCGYLQQVNARFDGCVKCGPNQYVDVEEKRGGGCVTCSEGTYFTKVDGTKDRWGCLPCPPGFFRGDTTVQACVQCGSMQYQPRNGSTTCLTCARGFFPNPLHTNCSECKLNTSLLPYARFALDSVQACMLECDPQRAWSSGASAETVGGCRPCSERVPAVGYYQVIPLLLSFSL